MSFMKKILETNIQIWDKCAASPFIRELKNGELPLKKFKNYIIQDSIYLKHYARIYGKAIYQSTILKDIQLYYSILSFVTNTESEVRLKYLKQFNMTDDDIEYIEPMPENQNYIDFMIQIAERGDVNQILMAILPCILSYSYIFRKVINMPETLKSRYYDFIKDYAEDKYFESCKQLIDFANKKCSLLEQEKQNELGLIFERASFLELDFWNMAYLDVE